MSIPLLYVVIGCSMTLLSLPYKTKQAQLPKFYFAAYVFCIPCHLSNLLQDHLPHEVCSRARHVSPAVVSQAAD